MKLVIISDTHGYFPSTMPAADVLIHCGDATKRGTEAQHREFVKWLDSQPHALKLYVAGNHCLFSETCYLEDEEELVNLNSTSGTVHYLRDRAYTYQGVKFYGTPWTPTFNDWAFMYHNRSQGHEHFAKIPEGTDVLISHGPPYGILDSCPDTSGDGMKKAGSKELLYHINRVGPKVVCYGHIHEGHGMVIKDGITYVNAAHCTGNYKPLNAIQVIEI